MLDTRKGKRALHRAQHLARVDATSQYLLHAHPILEMSPKGSCLRIQVPSSASAHEEILESRSEVMVCVTVFVTSTILIFRIEVGEVSLNSFCSKGTFESALTRVFVEEMSSVVKAWRYGKGSSSERG